MTCPRGGSLEDGIRRHGREPESDCHKWPEGGPSFPMGKGFTQASLSRTLQWKGHVLLRPGLTASEGNTWEFKRLLSGIQSHFETNGSLGPRVRCIPLAWLPSSPSAEDSALDRMVWREVEPPSPRRQLGVSVAELCAMCTWATTCDVGQTEPGRGTVPLPTERADGFSETRSTCCRESENPRHRRNTRVLAKRKTKPPTPPGAAKGGDGP